MEDKRMKKYKVIASYGNERQTVGYYNTIDQARKKQTEVVNQIPLSALEEHITFTIESVKHRQ